MIIHQKSPLEITCLGFALNYFRKEHYSGDGQTKSPDLSIKKGIHVTTTFVLS